MNRLLLIALFVWAAASEVSAAPPYRPYVDPTQLDCPWPKHSDYKQPWRGYLQTKPAVDFLAGIGVNWASPGNDQLAVRLLAEAGFKAMPIEIGWGSVKWDESGIHNHDRMLQLLKLCKQHGIRPTMLLNAHQGVPCPTKFFERRLAADASKGNRSIRLTDVKDLVIGRSGLSQLSDYWAAEALITAIDADTGECQLSKPMQEQQYQLAIRGLPAGTMPRTLHDPITNDGLSLQAARDGETVEVTVPVLDYPRLMVVD